MCRASDVGWEFFDNGFEFLINPSTQSVCNTTGCQSDWARLPGCFVYLGSDVKVNVLVVDLGGSPEKCVVIFRYGVMVVSEKFDDILCVGSDGLLRIVGF